MLIFIFINFSAAAVFSQSELDVDADKPKIFSIYFGGGSYWIDPDQETDLINWLDGIEHLERYEIVIQSHTDNIGSLEFNQYLSDMRSRAVFEELIEYTIPASVIEIKSFGELDPTFSNDSWEGKLKNRRADVILKPIAL